MLVTFPNSQAPPLPMLPSLAMWILPAPNRVMPVYVLPVSVTKISPVSGEVWAS